MNKYVHGYSDYEANRLHDQADSLADLLHYDSVWEKGSIILEAGCGIGAQTKIVAPKNKNSKFISIDISLESLDKQGLLLILTELIMLYFSKPIYSHYHLEMNILIIFFYLLF